mgnify:CR=1 FL=1
MLKELSIKNMAVIDREEVKFNNGFSTLTGETGAGKSVLIDSVNMILGHRTDKELVRFGEKSAVCEALFETDLESVKLILEEEGIFDFDGKVLISRSLSESGKSVARVNGVVVSAAFLKKLGAELINIHGQQDNQKLLEKKYHTDILDGYIKAMGEGEALVRYGEAYEKYKDAKEKYDAFLKISEDTEKEINYLRFVSDELSEAGVFPGEEKSLEERQEVLANAKEIYDNLSFVYALLYDGEENIYSALGDAANRLKRVFAYSDALKEIYEELNDCLFKIKDIAVSSREFRDDNAPDEAALSEVEERLGLIFDLKRKYRVSSDELEKLLEETNEKLESLEKEDIDYLLCDLNEKREIAEKIAKEVSSLRVKYKKILEERIENALADLNMKSTEFEIALSATELSPLGCEEAEFMMCTTGDGKMRPMQKIASGGELSRIMLAIKYVISEIDECETLVFDEVDTGVSGVSAEAVASKLKALSKSKQVICITHLAQIASKADNHLLIEKQKGSDGVFYAKAKLLDQEGRIRELGRIMGGSLGGDNVYQAAADMLKHN